MTGDNDLAFKHPEHWRLIVAGLDRLIEVAQTAYACSLSLTTSPQVLDKLYPGQLQAPLRPSQKAGYDAIMGYYEQKLQNEKELFQEATHAEARVVLLFEYDSKACGPVALSPALRCMECSSCFNLHVRLPSSLSTSLWSTPPSMSHLASHGTLCALPAVYVSIVSAGRGL